MLNVTWFADSPHCVASIQCGSLIMVLTDLSTTMVAVMTSVPFDAEEFAYRFHHVVLSHILCGRMGTVQEDVALVNRPMRNKCK